MLLMHTAPRNLRTALWRVLVLVLALAQLHPALAQLPTRTPQSTGTPQTSTPAAPPSSAITWKTCNPPPMCFRSKQARQQWAKDNQCQFLEDVCEGAPAKPDNQGAKQEDKGFWGALWDDVKGALVYGYEFVKGLIHGLKDQVTDLWQMLTNPAEVISGLVELGKAFFNDPDGTLKMLAGLLGQEAIDTIKRATQCGAYDLGKVIGKNVNPGAMFKLAVNLSKYGGKLADAVKGTRREFGCASFAADTLVHTPRGMVPIEQIRAGQQVQSRHDRLFGDAPQTVTKTFARTAPSYRRLSTEFDQFKLTDEHPLWVQGKGWTQARHITDDDVIAGAQGDVRVLGNEPVQQPLPVYNFSVAKTANYFVGTGAIWAHNANCDAAVHIKPWKDCTPLEKGFRGEVITFMDMIKAGAEPLGRTLGLNPKGRSPVQAFKAWHGRTGIDGIYKVRSKVRDKHGNVVKDKDGKDVEEVTYVIIESKATGGMKNGVLDDIVAKLTKNKKNDRQMSEAWIERNLKNMGLSAADKNAITAGLRDPKKVKRIYAQTDAEGTTYHEIRGIGKDGKPSVTEARVSNVVFDPQSLKGT
ncbi:hypothetical protein Veis_0256 [Verminephrobacter eiseniae EF01-2]|uniref:Intein C-terminal splicing domain-containing protein n=2 Tax=Verminephrobacter eiseniae TaxID=364317 RepID=A1WEJ0_VEREI|nr:polymorphic toxin-type HINT domain-containing protein [Verminephrobacter eiseniae]ABM56047.1 hypothetical protein Veis_0256 [Verminephrobacter eiseniae EF01-2]MCW5286419.1 hypothetical protein [Verminephrobacter eiseniae]MCW8192448.1 hypothetical protein [Verminephrobacter eiseniae]